MIRSGLLALVLAGPGEAEIKRPDGFDLGFAVDARISEMVKDAGEDSSHRACKVGGWCVNSGMVINLQDDNAPDGHIERLLAAQSPPNGSDVEAALVAEVPNPSRDLAVALRVEPMIGLAQVAGYGQTGVPQSVAEAALLLQGATVDVGWTHAEAL